MQILIMKNDENEFLTAVNDKLVAGWRMVSPITVGTTSKSVSVWKAFPAGREYFPLYSAVLEKKDEVTTVIGPG